MTSLGALLGMAPESGCGHVGGLSITDRRKEKEKKKEEKKEKMEKQSRDPTLSLFLTAMTTWVIARHSGHLTMPRSILQSCYVKTNTFSHHRLE